ncbi:acyltransferase [Planctomycetota bacterium]|nr:acyltransferase [Planctomycetota bacterium]
MPESELRPQGALGRVVSEGSYIPALDGLRFVAIATVVLFHANGRLATKHGLELPLASKAFSTGAFGVEFFFAISGFILAYQYWKRPQFKYAEYLTRRLKRIEPPFILAMCTQLALALAFGGAPTRDYLRSFAQMTTYTSNIFGGNIINGATWSLEVEVQFYIILPLALAAASKASSVATWLRPTVLLLLVNAISWFISAHLEYKTLFHYASFFSVGILTAWLKVFQPGRRLPRLNGLSTCLVIAVIFGIRLLDLQSTLVSGVRVIAMAALFSSILIHDSGSSILKNRTLTSIGGMCYSIYLWHIPALSLTDRFLCPRITEALGCSPAAYGLAMAAMVCATLALSVPAFLLTEKPFMYRRWSWSFLWRRLRA